MDSVSEKEKYIKEIAEKVSKVSYKDIGYREVKKEDIESLTQDEVLKVHHPKGFDILIRKEYLIELVLNIPTLMYSKNYIVSDPILGKHDVLYNAEDMAEYVNGLLGFASEE